MISVNGNILEQLLDQGVSINPIDDETLVLKHLCIDSSKFNKKSSNVLFRYLQRYRRFIICVDADLEFTGSDKKLKRIFREFRKLKEQDGWRPLLNVLTITLNSAITRAMEILGTPALQPSAQSDRTFPSQNTEETRGEILKNYTIDITEKAQLKTLPPTIGRLTQMNLLISILKKWEHPRTPVIQGYSGVGKTNLIYGISNLLLSEKSPLRLLLLDLVGLIAGCIFPGEREDLLKRAFDEMNDLPNHVFIIEELNLLPKLCPEGILLLRRALDKGVRMIGTTRSRLLKPFQESVMHRRLFIVPLQEPTTEKTLQILKGLQPTIEQHHSIELPDAVIQYCMSQSESWSGKFPAKAIDLLDLVCSQLALSKGHTVALDDVIGVANIYQDRSVSSEKNDARHT